MKISKTQQEVLDILKDSRNHLHFMGYMGRFNPNPYYFAHNHLGKHIRISTVHALLKMGLVIRKEINQFGGHRIFIRDKK